MYRKNKVSLVFRWFIKKQLRGSGGRHGPRRVWAEPTVYCPKGIMSYDRVSSLSVGRVVRMNKMPWSRRMGYAMRMGMRHRRNLIALLRRHGMAPNVATLEPNTLKKRGISILAVDFDGVLASHGEDHPKPKTAIWLQECVRVFGAEGVFILTNKPSLARKDYFQKKFPGITVVSGVRKKPFPDGLNCIIHTTGVHSDMVLLLDDRLLTGGVAACLAGTQMIYISRPYIGWSKRPVQETFFFFLRHLERIFLGLGFLSFNLFGIKNHHGIKNESNLKEKR